MSQALDLLLIVALTLNFVALGVSRIRGVITAVACQGALLGFLPLLVDADLGPRAYLLIVVTIALKGFVIPKFLLHAMREADIRHEVNPLVSYTASLLLGAAGSGLALMFSRTLPLAEEHCFSPENERRHYRRMANIERAIAADPDISPTYRALLLLLAEWFDRRAGRSRRPGVAELRATVEELKGDLADEPRRGRSAEVRISKTSLSRSGPARRR